MVASAVSASAAIALAERQAGTVVGRAVAAGGDWVASATDGSLRGDDGVAAAEGGKVHEETVATARRTASDIRRPTRWVCRTGE
jgi:hypothetical protein